MRMGVKLEIACVDDKDFMRNIYQAYLHDLSEFNDSLELDCKGLFDDSWIDSYYYKDNLMPFKITLDGRVIGFIFCSIGETVDYIVQDIFILRNYRNKGLSKLALKQLFNIYKGTFGLDVLITNEPAMLFWKNCLKDFKIYYTTSKVGSESERCMRFFFDTGASLWGKDPVDSIDKCN